MELVFLLIKNNIYIYLIGFIFNAFDYGPEENMRRYGTETPKSYNLKQVTVPVHIFWGGGDYIANPQVSIFI